MSGMVSSKIGRLVRNEKHTLSYDRARQVRRQERLPGPPPKKRPRLLGNPHDGARRRHPILGMYGLGISSMTGYLEEAVAGF